MENENRGRASRASSTSSLGREVRCACQFYHCDSLLPERQAQRGILPLRSTMVQTPPLAKKPVLCSEHDYEPIGGAMPPVKRILAPVVRITDTDVMPVADSDDSIDDPGRFHAAITLDGDLILPLDGRLEDSVMEGKELMHDGDTPEEEETVEQYQQRIEQRFLENPIDKKASQQTETKQPQSQRASKSLQKLRNQAGKLRTRLKGIQRPTFNLPSRQKVSKSPKSKPSSPVKKIEKPESKKVSKLERIRMSLPERPKFTKINLPDPSKFNIKRPNINFPGRQKAPTIKEQQRQRSTESTYGSRRNIFDFSTMPRLFRSKDSNLPSSKNSESLPPSTEGSTLPRARKSLSLTARWTQRFDETKTLDDDTSALERSRPWRHPSLEEPRLAFEIQQTLGIDEGEKMTWEPMDKKEGLTESQEIRYMEYEEELKAKGEFPDENDYKLNEDELELKLIHQELKLKAIQDEIDPRLYGDQTVHEEEDSEKADPDSYEQEIVDKIKMNFPPIDSKDFRPRAPSLPQSEEGSMRSDREIQSSGSSSERRRHGVIEEIDSDEFFLRERGISEEDMNMGRYLANEIRDALRATSMIDENLIPPERPRRSKSVKSQKEESVPPIRPKRERSIRRSQESFQSVGKPAKHRIVYRADSSGSREKSPAEPLDDIVILKPVRRKSKTSLISQGLVNDQLSTELPPIVPARKKRGWLKASQEKRMTAPTIDTDWPRITNLITASSEPVIQKEFDDEIQMMDEEDYIEPAPIVPKRRSRSRGTSLPRDEDRTSHGAESLPEVGYEEDEIPKDDDSRDVLPGYAVIEKKDKPPGAPPRMRRRKFATTPRPKRPQRAYSTLGPPRPRTPIEMSLPIDSDFHPCFEMEELGHLNKIQGRPLPAPPRPPRSRRGRSAEPSEPPSTTEVYASTQTDPLPDDIVIEEEITQAKLIMTPSRSGSQIMISTERISTATPPIPPLPVTQTDHDDLSKEKERENFLNESESKQDTVRTSLEESALERALRSNEPLRISSLEVGDLRVDRLSVAQLEAYKIAASEIDAIVMSASEMTRKTGPNEEEEERSLHPSLLKELLAIRSHLETVSGNIQNQERAPSRQRTEDACTATSDERIDRISAEEVESTAASKQKQDTTLTETQSSQCRVLQVTEDESSKKQRPVRQSASPVRSLPPVISVTPDTGTVTPPREITSTEIRPQRAVISYTRESSGESKLPKTFEDSHLQKYVAFQRSRASRDPFYLGTERDHEASFQEEPSVVDSFSQLMNVLRISSARTMSQFVRYVEGKISTDESEEKVREVELTMCALLLVIAGLIVIYICTPHTVTHHHHWDFFNPPKG